MVPQKFKNGHPVKQGLYDPANEKDSCGVGFIAHIKGDRSHAIIKDANHILRRMDHRGACGCESNSGDGAGIMTALPHEFFKAVLKDDLNIDLPEPGRYGAGIVFLPTDPDQRQTCKDTVESTLEAIGQKLITWRQLPTDSKTADIGPTPLAVEPVMEQLFIEAADGVDQEALERKLYVLRKVTTKNLHNSNISQANYFYYSSLSTKVIVYKGQLTPAQLEPYFPDLQDERYTSHLAMVHSRFSTNTFPSWDRAQPCRFMSHNGEINTLRGNINWMRARTSMLESNLFGDDLKKIMPIIDADCSDSGNFDNVLEFLLMGGRSLPEAVMMMVPEAWQNHETMSETKRAFYEYHSALMEPWDGPASIVYTDGHYIGALLDRNGLRPSRFYVTKDDRVIMASEVGVLDVEPTNILSKGRLQPGKMFLVDFEQGRIITDDELKEEIAAKRPYNTWLKDQRIALSDLPIKETRGFDPVTLIPRLKTFGYNIETVQFMLAPLIHIEKDPIGSMGNDAALACLSDKPRMVFDYFKQLFAQVTNPPIDAIREEVVMSLESYIGPEGNLLKSSKQQANRLLLAHPILTNEDLGKIKGMDHRGWQTKTIDITWNAKNGSDGMLPAIQRVCKEAEEAIGEGYPLIVLSDRRIKQGRIPIPILLASSSVHQYLVRREKRTQIGIILETGEAREVHHHCLLVGFGADAINPYAAYEALWQALRDGLLDKQHTWTDQKIVKSYRKGCAKGMLKVMGKMGISTLQSYKGAQIFEAVGLNHEVISTSFTNTASRIEGVDFKILAEEAIRRYDLGFPNRSESSIPVALDNNGDFHWRKSGEKHAWTPETIASLQEAARSDSKGAYNTFKNLVNEQNEKGLTLRGLLKFKPLTSGPVPIEEVVEAKEIVKRFCTGAMSYGSISRQSHEALAIAMNRIGAKSNTGEGGENSKRFIPMANGDSKRSAIKQVASGRFGVTSFYLTNADEIQIKMAQGAKPGEGGELPGHKVNEIIAQVRHSTPGVGLISPPPHHDIYSIEDLAQLIFDLKNANPSARISVKLVSEVGVGTIAAGVVKGHADHILIAGHDGGTGASPQTSIKHAGLPWELGIAETHQTLVMNNLRSRVVLQTDGQMKTGRDVAIGFLLGAEEIGMSTAPLITLGCIMMRKCHMNTCPVGIATQDPELRKRFKGRPEHVINYMFMVAEELREIMAELGFKGLNEMVGRVDALDVSEAINHYKTCGLDLTSILSPAVKPSEDTEVYNTIKQNHGLDNILDHTLIAKAQDAIKNGTKTTIDLDICNLNRATGTMLSHEISKALGEKGFKDDDTLHINFKGSAGQSLGAWLAHGVTIELEGDANDYVGKGLSGGNVIIYPPKDATYVPEDNILLGNVALYGATSGQGYFRGVAAERFCVRNSGATAVVEGVGDHGCEYMTGGRAIILGPTGRNFAAGMSGGIAYVWDPKGLFSINCNHATVALEALEDTLDVEEVKNLIDQHFKLTGSTIAQNILEHWEQSIKAFVKVMPLDYKRVLAERMDHSEEEDTPIHDGEEAKRG